MNEEEKIALFDAYQADELSLSEKTEFETLLTKSEDFKKDYESYLEDAAAIKSGAEYGKLKADLKNIHNKLYPRKKSFFLRPLFYIPAAAAACFILLITIKPLGSSNETAMADDNSSYQELATATEEMETVEESVKDESDFEAQDSILSNAEALNQEVTFEYIEPKGSCFLISSNGYFITAKHLVNKRRYVKLQQADLKMTFNTEVIYRDSILDFAILKCSDENAKLLSNVPFKLKTTQPSLGDEVFTLGYPKADIVYTKGSVSSANGFKSDSSTYEVSMPANPGNSGAPLFSAKGDLIGFIIANNSKKQSVTYVLKPKYIQQRINDLQDQHEIDLRLNYSKRYATTSELIKKIRPFVFEVH